MQSAPDAGDGAGAAAARDRTQGPDRADRPGRRRGQDPVAAGARRDLDRPATPRPVAGPARAAVSDTAPGTVTTTPVPPAALQVTPRALTTTIPWVDGRQVVELDLVGPFATLLQDVGHTIDRVAPRVLGPVAEPLARLVPLLLAMLGAFLALQRGIGRGLGHVPMVTTTPRGNADVRV